MKLFIFSVPNPGGISETQPFLICALRASICLRLSSVKHDPVNDFHFFRRLSRFSSIVRSFGMFVERISFSISNFHILIPAPLFDVVIYGVYFNIEKGERVLGYRRKRCIITFVHDCTYCLITTGNKYLKPC